MSRPTARIHRPASARARIVVDLPHNPALVRDREAWLRAVCGRGTRPEWGATGNGTRVLRVARPHFRRVVVAVARKYGEVLVIVDHVATSVCGRLCVEAQREECTCSCMGENHGGQEWRQEWLQVSEDWGVNHDRKRTRYLVTRAMVTERPARPARPRSLGARLYLASQNRPEEAR
ncbi:hypothetical protein [Pseudonocardia alni]|uniref:Uncharacterized protein n=1 Tax=Pseudonocardia alni TaxID=33907 RepID=A0A852VVC1_PSEA5|nr:hypothetical protein [Pseudonocardia antarctica]NYG00367.1 hypothetical protein [Pseudonocardia antarctica]